MKQKIVAVMVALAASLGAASLDELAQDGDGAYLISSSDDWNTLSAVLAAGIETSGKTFRQTENISANLMLGTEANPFAGTYEGGGHVLAVMYEDTSNSFVAPFSHIAGATITGLKVTGSVTGKRHSAGLVGATNGGANTISNCRVSVAVTVDDGYCGGIVGHGQSSRTDFVGCAFDGSLTVTDSNAINSGVFIGWGDDVTVTLTDCLDLSDCAYPLGKGHGTVTATRVYYTRADKRWNDDHYALPRIGKLVFTVTAGDDVALDLFGAPLCYEAAGIRFAEGTDGLFCGDILYAGGGDCVKLSLDYTGMETDPRFRVSRGALTADGGAYVLVLPDSGGDVTVSAVFSPVLQVSYFDPVGGTNATCTDCESYTGQTTLTSGWYAVEGIVTNGTRITVSGDVNLILTDGAELAAEKGIEVIADGSITNSLTIWAQSEGANMGKLTAQAGNYAAGIGGGSNKAGGTITINGGAVNATGGYGSAGVGGSINNAGGTITINGGAVNATGGYGSAGVGGGGHGAGGTITINGGAMTAHGGNYAAGVGGGDDGAGGTITINGGAVNATGGEYGAGIGGGDDGAGGTITINGGTVNAAGKGAGIGGGDEGAGGTITVSGGEVTATGGNYAAGIGGGESNAGGTITISGGSITATGGYTGAGIGSGGGDSVKDGSIAGGEITISGGSIAATGGASGAGIGGGRFGTGGTINISDGMVTATGVSGGAGIGGGDEGAGGTITISGGTVTATGGSMGAGIGGGAGGAGGMITINGGTVTAKGDETACIGRGWGSDDGLLAIGDGMSVGYVYDNIVVYRATFGERVDLCRSTASQGVRIEACYSHRYEKDLCIYCGDLNPIISYVDPVSGTNAFCDAYTLCTNQTTLNSGWYVVLGTVTNDVRMVVSGDVNILLMDGAELTANKGITVDANNNITNSLTIWAQSKGADMGKLTAQGYGGAAGIGGDDGGACGAVTVNGGAVTALGESGAGIGGGAGGAGGAVTVDGGTITACSRNGGAAIGGGLDATDHGSLSLDIMKVGYGEDEDSVDCWAEPGERQDYCRNTEGSTVLLMVCDPHTDNNANHFCDCCGFTLLLPLDAGEYFKATLAELGYEVPTDGTPYTVKAYGLPSGLKLMSNKAVTKKVKKGKKTVTVVVKAAKSEWWIEGVPTAALDYDTNPPYLVITANGQTDTFPIPVGVLAQGVTDLGTFPLGTAWDVQTPLYLPGVTSSVWKVSGLPTGLKYTAKLLTKKSKVKVKEKVKTVVTTNALPYSVYGKTTKAGLYTITAKRKVGAFYETMKYRMLVTPKAPDAAIFGELPTNITTMAYVPVAWDLEEGGSGRLGEAALPGEDGGHAGRVPLPTVPTVAKVTGLPGGVVFASANVYKDKKKTKLKQLGQTIVGTPTKPGTYVVTFTRNMTTGTGKNKKTVAKTAQMLWKVVANDAPLSLGFNTAGGVIESGMVGLKYGDLLAFSATSNATVTASGLPAGIKLVRLEEGDGEGGRLGEAALPGEATYAFTGFTTKAGTYLVTVKATLNGKTVTQRLALKVEGLPSWAKGTFNGVVSATGETPVVPVVGGDATGGTPVVPVVGGDATGGTPVVPVDGQDACSTNGLATITVSSAGKISGKFYEGGTNWTLSADSYTDGRARSPSGPQSQASGSQNNAESGTRDACPYLEFICSNLVAKYSWKVKSGKKTITKSVTRKFALAVAEAGTRDACPYRGVAAMVEVGVADVSSATTIDAWQNLWGSTYKALGKQLFYTSKKKQYKTFAYGVYTNEMGSVCFVNDGEGGRLGEAALPGLTYFAALSFKVTTGGVVTATLTYDTGKTQKDKKTKKMVKVIYKPTCSTVVIPTTPADADPFEGEVPLYFAPSTANGFEGFAGSVAVP